MDHIIDANRTFVQNLFHEVRERAVAQGIESEEEFRDLVGEVVDEKLKDGILTKHDDVVQIENDLSRRWPEVQAELPH
jgi:hypothetical protein